jgi:hypothetical protein
MVPGKAGGILALDLFKKAWLWKYRVFVIRAKAQWLERCSTDLCANIN